MAARDLLLHGTLKLQKGTSMINTKHVLIMRSSYPLMVPTSLHTPVVCCQVGKLRGVGGSTARLCRKSTTNPLDTDVALKPPVTTGIQGRRWDQVGLAFTWPRRTRG